MSSATTYPDPVARDEIEKLRKEVDGLKEQIGYISTVNLSGLGTFAQRIRNLEYEVKQINERLDRKG